MLVLSSLPPSVPAKCQITIGGTLIHSGEDPDKAFKEFCLCRKLPWAHGYAIVLTRASEVWASFTPSRNENNPETQPC